jgi:hypothetical protein
MISIASRLIALSALTLIIAAGCNTVVLSTFKAPSPAVQQTLVALTQNYLESIVNGNEERMLNFRAFSPSGKDQIGLARDEITAQLKANPAKNHPLLGYQIVEVLAKENEAKVLLKKPQGDTSPSPTVFFFWAGRGWVITHDEIFGPDGLLAQ